MSAPAETVPRGFVESINHPRPPADGEALHLSTWQFESPELALQMKDAAPALLTPTNIELPDPRQPVQVVRAPLWFRGPNGRADMAQAVVSTSIGTREPERIGYIKPSVIGCVLRLDRRGRPDFMQLEIFNRYDSILKLALIKSDVNGHDPRQAELVTVSVQTYHPQMRNVEVGEHVAARREAVRRYVTGYIGELVTKATDPLRQLAPGCPDIEFEHPFLQKLNADRLQATHAAANEQGVQASSGYL